MPISDNVQSILVMIANILLSAGTVTVPLSIIEKFPDIATYLGIVSLIGGIILHGVKEKLGSSNVNGDLPAIQQSVSGPSGIKAQSQPPTNPTDVSGFTVDQ